jgi:shikimate kinase
MNEHLPADLAARPGAPDLSLDEAIKRRLGKRSIVLVGLMGAGKSTVGRRLATRLDLRFTDADAEIETAAGMSIPDMFAMHGEAYFRDGERRVIARLLGEGPAVLATGGGAYMHPETRARIGEAGIAVWLRADLDVLMRRVRKRHNRPLLQNPDPEGTMRRLIEARHPIYALADVTVDSREIPHEKVVQDALLAIDAWLSEQRR